MIGGSDCPQCAQWDGSGPGARNSAHVRMGDATTSLADVPARRAGPGTTAPEVQQHTHNELTYLLHVLHAFI